MSEPVTVNKLDSDASEFNIETLDDVGIKPSQPLPPLLTGGASGTLPPANNTPVLLVQNNDDDKATSPGPVNKFMSKTKKAVPNTGFSKKAKFIRRQKAIEADKAEKDAKQDGADKAGADKADVDDKKDDMDEKKKVDDENDKTPSLFSAAKANHLNISELRDIFEKEYKIVRDMSTTELYNLRDEMATAEFKELCADTIVNAILQLIDDSDMKKLTLKMMLVRGTLKIGC